MHPFIPLFLCSRVSVGLLSLHSLLQSSCLISHFPFSSLFPSLSLSQLPQAFCALWPFLPLQDCISPASPLPPSNPSRTILEAELALWQKKKETSWKENLTHKGGKHLQMSVGGFAKSSACSHVELPALCFPLWGGGEGEKHLRLDDWADPRN